MLSKDPVIYSKLYNALPVPFNWSSTFQTADSKSNAYFFTALEHFSVDRLLISGIPCVLSRGSSGMSVGTSGSLEMKQLIEKQQTQYTFFVAKYCSSLLFYWPLQYSRYHPWCELAKWTCCMKSVGENFVCAWVSRVSYSSPHYVFWKHYPTPNKHEHYMHTHSCLTNNSTSHVHVQNTVPF